MIVDSKINKKFANNTKKFKKPWAFLSIDTSEDQVKIPEEILKKIIFKLKKKNKTIFINTNYENILKIKNYKKYKLTCTSKYNVSEIAYLIKNSKIFIGNESGPAAIASLYNKKSLLFFSKIVKIETKFMPNVNKRHYFKVEKISLKKNRFLNFI